MKKNYRLLLTTCLILGSFLMIEAQNLISNSGFELGSGDVFTNWTKANGSSYLTATSIGTEVHGGTRALKSSGPGFAGQQYQVQMLSDAMTTIIGTSYTFKIWVKAANTGGNIRFSTQPNALYGGDTNVPDGTWTQLSWTFTANEASTKIALDLGQSNVIYYLDDAELSLTPVNIIPNPGLELGTGDVFTNWSKYNGAAYLTATSIASEVHGGTRALKSAGPGFAGQQYQVQLVSDLIPTIIGTSYTFKIWAKAVTSGGNIRFSTQPNALYSGDTNVPDGTWTQLSWTFTANEANTRIALDLGQSNVVYYLDDMEILSTPIVTSPVVLTNYMPNKSFEDGTGSTFTNWSELNGAGSFSETTVPAEVKVGSRAIKVISTISDTGNPWKVQLGSAFLNTPVGKHFSYSIYIKVVSGTGKVRLSTISPLANYGAYGYSSLTDVGTDWQKVTLDFIPVEPTTRVAFDLGGAANTYFVDDLSLTTTDALVIGNGDFETGLNDNFTNWTKQNGATFLTTTTTNNHLGTRALRAEVTGTQSNAGQPWSVQMINDAVNTTIGSQYTFSVWAKAATTGGQIRFSTDNGSPSLYSADFNVTTTWTKISWTFTANQTQTKMVLDLGKDIEIYFIDDIEIIPAIVNLVVNGSFETGTASSYTYNGSYWAGDVFTNWSAYNGGDRMTPTTVSTEVKEGSRAVKVINSVSGNSYETQLVSDPMTLTVGKNYMATIQVRSNTGGEVIRFSTNSTSSALYGPDYTTTTGWAVMTWNFTANNTSTRIVLDMGKSAGTFFVDDIQVVEIGNCDIKYQIPAGQTPIASGKNKFLGMIYSTAQKPNLNKYFNQVTPENAGKWASVEGTEGTFDFSGVDEAREYAKVNNFPFRYHVLVWGSQQPTWLKPMTDAQKVVKIKTWFKAVANHFDGSSNARAKLEYLEVANETLNDPPNNSNNATPQFPYRPDNTGDAGSGDYVNALKTLNTELGTTPGTYDWIVNAFKLARKYFPCETKFVLNDYGIESDVNMNADYVALITTLKNENLLDVVGMQTHTFSTQLYSPYTPSNITAANTNLLNNLNNIAETNLPVMVTELDIDGDVTLDASFNRVTTGTQADKDAFQKAEYERIFNIYWNHPSVIGVTLWGYLTGHWRTSNGAFLVDECTGNEKPALRDYLNNTLNNTQTSVRASANPPLGTGFATKTCIIPTNISIATGDWMNVSTWELGRIPKIGDNVIIDTPHTVTLMGEGSAKSVQQKGTLNLSTTSSNLKLGF
jgi:GH35 family endo-1,4-beta-xylanase